MRLKLVILAITVVNITAVGYCLYSASKRNAFIDTSRLYDGFRLTSELSDKLELEFNQQKKSLDSLYNAIAGKSPVKLHNGQVKENPDQSQVNMLIYELEEKQKQFDRDIRMKDAKASQKIWSQLNQYVSDFGKHYNYDFILGANGQGSVMYSDDVNDITNEVIAYANDRYAGLN